ncbi:hypothetical protein EMIT0215P_20322 [Pseudomonas serboccidentalis]
MAGSEYANRSFEVISVHRQGHFRFCYLQLAQQEATVPKQPLLEIAERVLNDGAAQIARFSHSLFGPFFIYNHQQLSTPVKHSYKRPEQFLFSLHPRLELPF